MEKFQLISCMVEIGGSRNHTVAKNGVEAVTLPEVIVLRALHGGEAHVHTLVDEGTFAERTHQDEFDRLKLTYGDVVQEVFPMIAGRIGLPARDDGLPTQAEISAGNKAAAKASAQVRATRQPKPAAQPKTAPAATADATNPIPDPDDEGADGTEDTEDLTGQSGLPGLDDLPE